MRVRLTSRAYGELQQISTYFADRSPATATSIFAVIERILSGLATTPYRGRATDVKDVRCIVVPRFPYKLFYRISGDTIEVLSIFHTSQDPDRQP